MPRQMISGTDLLHKINESLMDANINTALTSVHPLAEGEDYYGANWCPGFRSSSRVEDRKAVSNAVEEIVIGFAGIYDLEPEAED